MNSFGSWGYGDSVGERDKDQGERDEAPAVVADVVELEIVGCEIYLGGWAKP